MTKKISPQIQKKADIILESFSLADQEGKKLIELIENGLFEIPIELIQINLNQIRELDCYITQLKSIIKSKLSCKKGCIGCCKYPIWITEIERDTIIDWIKIHLSKELKIILQDNTHKWFKELGHLAKDLITFLEKSYDTYINKNYKCPFIYQDYCLIYPVRPLACRLYFSIGNPEECESELYPPNSLSLTWVMDSVYRSPIDLILLKKFGSDNKRLNDIRSKFFDYSYLLPLEIYKKDFGN